MIKMALGYAGISQAELARRVGMTHYNFSPKPQRMTYLLEEKERIAAALGGEWRAEFVFPGGIVI